MLVYNTKEPHSYKKLCGSLISNIELKIILCTS